MNVLYFCDSDFLNSGLTKLAGVLGEGVVGENEVTPSCFSSLHLLRVLMLVTISILQVVKARQQREAGGKKGRLASAGG